METTTLPTSEPEFSSPIPPLTAPLSWFMRPMKKLTHEIEANRGQSII